MHQQDVPVILAAGRQHARRQLLARHQQHPPCGVLRAGLTVAKNLKLSSLLAGYDLSRCGRNS